MTWKWRPVVGYEGRYEVSSSGQVRTLLRNKTGTLLRQYKNAKGYMMVSLRDAGGKKWSPRVQWLVAEAFIGPRPEGQVLRHLDGNGENNSVTNLRYGTQKENVADTVRHGRHKEARKTHCKWGHEFSPENTRIRPGNKRECKTCVRERDRRRYAERVEVA